MADVRLIPYWILFSHQQWKVDLYNILEICILMRKKSCQFPIKMETYLSLLYCTFYNLKMIVHTNKTREIDFVKHWSVWVILLHTEGCLLLEKSRRLLFSYNENPKHLQKIERLYRNVNFSQNSSFWGITGQYSPRTKVRHSLNYYYIYLK